MSNLPPTLQHILKQRYENKVLLEKRKEQEDPFLEQYPRYKAVGEFGGQALERLKEIGTDPETYKMAALATLLGIAFPPSIPFIIAGAAGAGTYSAYQQAQSGNYGAAAVDVGLGVLPLGTKGGRASFKPGAAKNVRARPVAAPEAAASSSVLANLRQRMQAAQQPPDVAFKIPEPKPPKEFADVLWDASKGVSELPPLTPWELVQAEMRLTSPPRQGMPGTTVRGVDGKPTRVSPYGLTDKEIRRIEKFGNAAEKDIISKAKQRKVGRAIGGEVGERIASSESPFIKGVVDKYYQTQREAGWAPQEPSIGQARETFRRSGIPVVPLEITQPKQPEIVMRPVIVLQPYQYSNRAEYIQAVQKEVRKKLTDEEIAELSKVYDESVRHAGYGARTLPIEPVHSVEYSDGFTSKKAPMPETLRKAASGAGVAVELATTGGAKTVEIPPPQPPAVVEVVPSTSRAIETTKVPSVPETRPTTGVSKTQSTAKSTTQIPVPVSSEEKPVSSEEPEKEKQVDTSQDSEVTKEQQKQIDQYNQITPAIAAASLFFPFKGSPNLPPKEIPQIPREPLAKRKFQIEPTKQEKKQPSDLQDLVALLAPDSEELRTALKRGQLGQISGYYQLA